MPLSSLSLGNFSQQTIINDPMQKDELIMGNRLTNNKRKNDSAGSSPPKKRGLFRCVSGVAKTIDFKIKCSPVEEVASEESSFYSCSSLVQVPSNESHVTTKAIDINNSDEIDLLGSSHGSQSQQPESIVTEGSLAVNQLSVTLTISDSDYSSHNSALESEDSEDIEKLLGSDSMDVDPHPLMIQELLLNEIKSSPDLKCKSARKRLDMDTFTDSPLTPKITTSSLASIITTPDRVYLGDISNTFWPRSGIKRPESPAASNPVKAIKKLRHEGDSSTTAKSSTLISVADLLPVVKKPTYRKSLSVDEAAMHFDDKNKTADFCYELCLPTLTKSKHSDLKSITPETMRRLLNGEFDNFVASYKIIDCRYPYEFEGGHIRGAQNLYTDNQIYEEFMKHGREISHISADGKRNIVIFHCEFSSERGPRQYRHLRNIDRATHTYPALQYPEIYLLEGGYKAFFEENKDLCEPQAYRLMVDPEFNAQYQDYRAKTKRSGTFGGETGGKMRMKSRSRLAL